MTCAVRLVWTLLAAAMLLSLPRYARAETPSARATPVYVLAVRTDDSDDQADALTLALRARVRVAAGWSLLDTNQSFETLSIALRCPPRPDGACLQRIGDQLKTDKYIWGTMRKRTAGQVIAELHLWSRGKPGTDATE